MSSILDDKLESYVWLLAKQAPDESEIFPVDRNFLEKRLDEIKSFNAVSFLYYNFEMVNDLYVTQLLACLPEIWTDIKLDDLITLSENFTNVFSYCTLIKYTYKYIEIDIIEIVLNIVAKKNRDDFKSVIEYLHKQWNVLIKSAETMMDFEDGFIDVDYHQWMNIKQSFLMDKRVKPALLTYTEVEEYVRRFVI
ncbi:hypothetical protein SNE26_16130 [Mucilaginibacter sp. cycad4]|uniref:hypothetical protein n=1 Tax=Mucilaginibacter sp. cycad4 TaxID=3342096 RepID=UPI002AAB680B|nr:hypothetical protein [Mucilaginibacter gossypii]WPU97555.1 hypothetical protein SNE26_16130 [Mucilaginibacter gossypii]